VVDSASDLARYIAAQEGYYQQALMEVRLGRKHSHWMWFIFPQIAGLGQSSVDALYAIKDLQEAANYLAHQTLGPRLIEISRAVHDRNLPEIRRVFKYPDDLKLCSCMTLFSQVPGADPVFTEVIDRYFQGKPCDLTLRLLSSSAAYR
jgi:uncharacterized protein (DUF1810 family)